MDTQERSRVHPVPSIGLFALWATILVLAGCGDPTGDRVVVATSWPLAERRRLETEFGAWVDSGPDRDGPKVRIQWLVLDDRTDPLKLAGRTEMPDVLLGGSPGIHGQLAAMDRLWIDQPGAPAPQVAFPHARERSALRLEDPRAVPTSLAFAVDRLCRGRWPQGYAELVRLAGAPNTDGNSDDSMSAAAVIECAAMFRASRREAAARRFLHFVAQTPGAEPAMAGPERPQVMDPLVESLIGDLLGATLVDARDELEAAWAALERTGEPDKALQWMTEPPSWPPVSVARYLSREGQTAMSLVDTLAQELAPDPGARAWLVRSWISPSRRSTTRCSPRSRTRPTGGSAVNQGFAPG
jgi:hypothetical protein